MGRGFPHISDRISLQRLFPSASFIGCGDVTVTEATDRSQSCEPGVLFTAIPGYQTLGTRGGLRVGRHELLVDLENLSDENYRGMSWGVDAAGRGLSVRYVARF